MKGVMDGMLVRLYEIEEDLVDEEELSGGRSRFDSSIEGRRGVRVEEMRPVKGGEIEDDGEVSQRRWRSDNKRTDPNRKLGRDTDCDRVVTLSRPGSGTRLCHVDLKHSPIELQLARRPNRSRHVSHAHSLCIWA